MNYATHPVKSIEYSSVVCKCVFVTCFSMTFWDCPVPGLDHTESKGVQHMLYCVLNTVQRIIPTYAILSIIPTYAILRAVCGAVYYTNMPYDSALLICFVPFASFSGTCFWFTKSARTACIHLYILFTVYIMGV
jgi:hypothetical protein